jgi:ATP-binding cassette subfamily F protein uup
LEAREYSTLEQRVEAAEELLQACREAIEDPTVAIDAVRLQKALKELDDAQNAVDALYARWAELEAKRT